MADAEAKQPQRARNQLLPRQEKTRQAIQFLRLGDGFFNGELASQGFEIAIPEFDLDSLRGEAFAFEFSQDIRCLVAQRFFQDPAVSTPARRRISSVTRPTPCNARTGSGLRN